MVIMGMLLWFSPLISVAQSDDSNQNERIIANSKMIGWGRTNLLDTYLSPEEYVGLDLRYISHTLRKRRNSRVIHELIHQGNIAYVDNRAHNGREIAGNYNFQFGLHYLFKTWNLSRNQLHFEAGGNAEVNLGFLYNTRNSNNPAQARLFINVVPTAALTYDFHHPFRPSEYRDFRLRYELGVPLVGLRFSPNYGQSYYEIFSKDNYDHNLVPTTIGNAPSLRQMLTLDFPLFHAVFRIGYQGEYLQAHINKLKFHAYTNTLLLGVTKTFKLTRVRR